MKRTPANPDLYEQNIVVLKDFRAAAKAKREEKSSSFWRRVRWFNVLVLVVIIAFWLVTCSLVKRVIP